MNASSSRPALKPSLQPSMQLTPSLSLPRQQFGRASVRDGALVFDEPDGLLRGLSDGCFFLAIPEGMDVRPGIELCRQFHRAPGDGPAHSRAYRGFRERSEIYFDRERFQTEHLLIDRPGRVLHFPDELIQLCDRMNEVAMVIMHQVMSVLGIPERERYRVTGGAACGHGTHWFAASHYRPERDQMGCAPHKDTGFVTVLYMEQEGLEAQIGGQWVPIDPEPGCFAVNFGRAFELLTEEMAAPVHAILHRVRQIRRRPGMEDRFSFAAFTNPPSDGVLYRYDAAGVAHPHQGVARFLAEFNRTTWNDRHDDFGIK